MKYLFAVSFFVFAIILSGCKNDVIPSNTDSLIEFGTQCGWCAGEEMLSISSTTIEYTRTIPCDENQGTTKKSKTITTAQWDSLCSSFNYDLFESLEYNECNYCADGCDEIIRITKNNNTHELRYSPEEDIEGLENLRQILAGLMTEMQNQN